MSESPARLSKACVWFFSMKGAMFKLAVRLWHMLTLSQLSLVKHLSSTFTGQPHAINLPLTYGRIANSHKRPAVNSLANVLNGAICIAVKGKEESRLQSTKHNSSQKGRGERRNSACSSWTLHFPLVNTEINLGQAAKALPWRSILSPRFTSKQKTLQEIQALLPSFSPGPVQCEPIYFSPHIPLPFFALSFCLIESIRLS